MVLMVRLRAAAYTLRPCTFAQHHSRFLAGTPAAQERYAWLSDGFQERFGSRPTLFARAPGKSMWCSAVHERITWPADSRT